MRMSGAVLALCALLLVQACERKGGTPPRPVTSALHSVAQVA